jgi:hypothetical protein
LTHVLHHREADARLSITPHQYKIGWHRPPGAILWEINLKYKAILLLVGIFALPLASADQGAGTGKDGLKFTLKCEGTHRDYSGGREYEYREQFSLVFSFEISPNSARAYTFQHSKWVQVEVTTNTYVIYTTLLAENEGWPKLTSIDRNTGELTYSWQSKDGDEGEQFTGLCQKVPWVKPPEQKF